MFSFVHVNISCFDSVIQIIQNSVTPMYDIKSPKFLFSFSCSLITTCAIVALLAISFNYLWSPPNRNRTVSVITPSSNPVVVGTDSPQQTKNEEKALVRSRTNSFSQDETNDTLISYGNGAVWPNFLPESHELKVFDDDIGSEFGGSYHLHVKKSVLPENDQEATRALHMAQHMKQNGKNEKAIKLFQHALALNPTHPDVLNHYGEFLEEHNKDIIKANHFYTRALVISPSHSKALQNRERTLPVVEELDEKELTRIDQKRDYLIQIPDHDSALKRVKKEAYFQHIHHTVAIEGNTMTLAETRMIVETRMAVPGKSIMEHNEIIGLEAALKYINNTLVSKFGRFLLNDILQIHKRVLGYVDPLEAGSFRTSQVYVGEHTPPPASDVQELMEEFVYWMNCEDTFNMHPVKFSALAHFKIVHIHPFVDGNGRTARLLMNLILMRAGYPPVIIRKQDRSIYYELLQTGNEGDIRPFIRFIAKCTERTLDYYLYATEYGSVTGMRALGSMENEHEHDHQVKIIEV